MLLEGARGAGKQLIALIANSVCALNAGFGTSTTNLVTPCVQQLSAESARWPETSRNFEGFGQARHVDIFQLGFLYCTRFRRLEGG